MFKNLFTVSKVHYLGNEETVTLAEFATDQFVEAAAGQNAFMSYVDLRLEGKPQLGAFVTAFGRTFCGKPEALQRAAEAFESTPDYQAAYSDGLQRIEAERRMEETRRAAELAAIDAPKPRGEVVLSDEAAADLARGMREHWARQAASGNVVLSEQAQGPEVGTKYLRNGLPVRNGQPL